MDGAPPLILKRSEAKICHVTEANLLHIFQQSCHSYCSNFFFFLMVCNNGIKLKFSNSLTNWED